MSRKYHLLNKYGITNDQFDDLLQRQGGACAVCKRSSLHWKSRLAVDHDHKSGEIRGLLCAYCNRWIVGRHRKEMGADLLRSAYDYLTRDYTGWIVPPKKKRRKKRRGLKKRIKKSL